MEKAPIVKRSVWSYRSFFNNPDLNTGLKDLELGDGTLNLAISSDGKITGKIGTAGEWSLNLTGKLLNTNPQGMTLIGTGVNKAGTGTALWEYGYEFYYLPKINGGINQATVLAGSVVRLKDHPGLDGTGDHKAGVVGTAYCVLH
ncbi:hypothetical protein [Chitinophaga sp. Cy-1792]|uniref:hypothetical protein n=1 Tax=Chitinophaga sp. Cy-1792 TaxID=2608339 RepID=UPI001423C1C2|nr:hypothetical protein [Chitinophaga sp. Cy-1792]NIG56416.1 hypothetical protein [Chitinophaga sp. Cy-1792]